MTTATTLLPLDQVRELLGVGTTRLYQLLNDGQLPAVKLGRSTHVRLADLEDFMAALPPYQPRGEGTRFAGTRATERRQRAA